MLSSSRRKNDRSELVRFVAGGTAAGVAEVATMPLDIAKVRLQIQGQQASRTDTAIVQRYASARHIVHRERLSHPTVRTLNGGRRKMLPNLPAPTSQLLPFQGEAVVRPNPAIRQTLSAVRDVSIASIPVAPSRVQYRGMTHAIASIARTEGAQSLFKGIAPALIRQVSYSALTLMSYEPIRNTISGSSKGSEIKLHHKLLAGGIAGSVSVALVNPADVIKVRMQADREGKRYRSTLHAFSHLWRTEGIHGLLIGAGPSVQRAFIVNAAELATYDHAKHLVISRAGVPDNIAAHFLASLLAGFVSALASNPLDVAKSRLMAQPAGSGQRLYAGMVDCLSRTVKTEGVLALYKGFLPNWMRKGPHVVITFLVYEQLCRLLSGSSLAS